MDLSDRSKKSERDYEFQRLIAQLPKSVNNYILIVLQKKADDRVWVEIRRKRNYLRSEEVEISLSCNVMGEYATREDDAIMERAQGMDFSELLRFLVLSNDFALHSILKTPGEIEAFEYSIRKEGFKPKYLRLSAIRESVYFSELKIF
jgi:hypothetical protein